MSEHGGTVRRIAADIGLFVAAWRRTAEPDAAERLPAGTDSVSLGDDDHRRVPPPSAKSKPCLGASRHSHYAAV